MIMMDHTNKLLLSELLGQMCAFVCVRVGVGCGVSISKCMTAMNTQYISSTKFFTIKSLLLSDNSCILKWDCVCPSNILPVIDTRRF